MKNKIMCSVTAIIALITGSAVVESELHHQVDRDTKSIGRVVIDGQYIDTLRITPKGLKLIINSEGCRLEPYRCPAGLLTNGVGNTHNVSAVAISEKQAAIDFVRNIKQAELCLTASQGSTDLNNAQWDGLTSFVFNTGCSRFRFNKDGSKTLIYTYVNQGKYSNACGQLERWVYSNGIKYQGLINRRKDEYARCIALD